VKSKRTWKNWTCVFLNQRQFQEWSPEQLPCVPSSARLLALWQRMDRVFLSRPGALQKGIYTASQTTIYFNSKGFREVDTKIYTAICFSQRLTVLLDRPKQCSQWKHPRYMSPGRVLLHIHPVYVLWREYTRGLYFRGCCPLSSTRPRGRFQWQRYYLHSTLGWLNRVRTILCALSTCFRFNPKEDLRRKCDRLRLDHNNNWTHLGLVLRNRGINARETISFCEQQFTHPWATSTDPNCYEDHYHVKYAVMRWIVCSKAPLLHVSRAT
jgi:hypothetical protein